jgi:hypothetical protein
MFPYINICTIFLLFYLFMVYNLFLLLLTYSPYPANIPYLQYLLRHETKFRT